ncbi:transposase [Aquabacterium sp.]|uniref:transposase n=1 Tax=Aquabacterium sp. TaxID=1872578 RepID=UPI0040380875
MTTDKTKKRIRRNHSQALKAQILSECDEPGASVAKVAMSHSINANIVHGWRKAERVQSQVVLPPETSCVGGFIPLTVEPEPTGPQAQGVTIELRRGALTVAMTWPLSATMEMAALMRELLR